MSDAVWEQVRQTAFKLAKLTVDIGLNVDVTASDGGFCSYLASCLFRHLYFVSPRSERHHSCQKFLKPQIWNSNKHFPLSLRAVIPFE